MTNASGLENLIRMMEKTLCGEVGRDNKENDDDDVVY